LTDENSTEKPNDQKQKVDPDTSIQLDTVNETGTGQEKNTETEKGEKTEQSPEENQEKEIDDGSEVGDVGEVESPGESVGDTCEESANEMPYISDESLDSQFKYEILNEPGGENFLRCMQCGTCTASCPVKTIDPDYNCRRIIRMALIGDKEQVLKSKFIWMCSTCYSCYERCPQDVKITDLMTALKNIAVKHGHIHPNIKELITLLEKFGGLTEVSDFENRMREKFGLPKINQSPDRVQKVFEKVKIKKIIEGES
jgi:heterodisulfide reductase subunit C